MFLFSGKHVLAFSETLFLYIQNNIKFTLKINENLEVINYF